MKFPVVCGTCGRTYHVPEKHLGQVVRCRCGEALELAEPPSMRVECPECGRGFTVPGRHLGKRVKCRCGESFELTVQHRADTVLVQRLDVGSYLLIAIALGILGAVLSDVWTALTGRVCGSEMEGPASLWLVHALGVVLAVLVSGCLFVWVFNWVIPRLGGLRVGLGGAVDWAPGRRTLRRIDPLSALRVAAVVSVVWAVVGAALIVVLGSTEMEFPDSIWLQLALSPVGVVVEYWVLVGAYNWIARKWGGIEAEVEPAEETSERELAGDTVAVRTQDWLRLAAVGAAEGLILGAVCVLPFAAIGLVAMVAGSGGSLWILLVPTVGCSVLFATGAALGAGVYNLAAYVVGGVEVEVG